MGSLGNSKEAVKELTKAIEISPQYKDAYIQRAFIYLILKDPDGAMNDFNEAIKMMNNLPTNDLTEDEGKEDAEIYFNRGDLLYKEYHKYEKAIDDYNKAIEIEPTFKEAYYYKGLCYEGLKKYKEAAENITKAIQNGLKDTTIYMKRANLFFTTEDYEKAIIDYTKLIHDFKMQDDIIYLHRGICYNRTGKYQPALKDLTRALGFYRENSDVYVERGIANTKLKLYSTAMTDFRNAEIYSPKNPKVFEFRGDMYNDMKNYDKAIEDYTKSIKLKSSAERYYKRGLCEETIHDKMRACQDYKIAAEGGNAEAGEKIKTLCK